jgi:hypothetical protein
MVPKGERPAKPIQTRLNLLSPVDSAIAKPSAFIAPLAVDVRGEMRVRRIFAIPGLLSGACPP